MNKIKKPCGKVIKKSFAVICTICLLLSFAAVTANAQTATVIKASSCTVERGDVASVTFNLSGNPGIWAIKLRLHYDSSALTLKSVTTGSVFGSGEFMFSETLKKNPYVVTATGSALANKTGNGTFVTLNFNVNSNAAYKSYPITTEISQIINVDGNKISADAVNGSVSVVACKHSNKEWRVTSAATCEKNGKETLTCKKCGATFETRTVNATGHKNTEVRNAVAATKTTDGYTGDTYCKSCGKLISKGKIIAKLKDNTPATTSSSANSSSKNSSSAISNDGTESSQSNEPEIKSGTDLIFTQNSNEPLVFVSDADLSEFLRVEIDGTVLEEKDYTLESGSTIVTVNAACLNKLSSGDHTISIVSKGGTATTQFKVQSEEKNTDIATPSDNNAVDSEVKSSKAPIIIAIIIVVLLCGGAAVFFMIRRRRV